jgi:hypothetical protein
MVELTCAAPMMPDLGEQRHRGVECIDWLALFLHEDS